MKSSARCFLCLAVVASAFGGVGFVSSATTGSPLAGNVTDSSGAGNHTRSSLATTNVMFNVTGSPICQPCLKKMRAKDGNRVDFFSSELPGNNEFCEEMKDLIMCLRENSCTESPEMKKCELAVDKKPQKPQTECEKCEHLLKKETDEAEFTELAPGTEEYCEPLYVPLTCFEVNKCQNTTELHKNVSSVCQTEACQKCRKSLEKAVENSAKILISIIGGSVCQVIETSVACLKDKSCLEVPEDIMTAAQLICPDLDISEAVTVTGPSFAAVIFLSAVVTRLAAWLHA